MLIFDHYFLMVFFTDIVRHAQEIHAGGDATHVHRGGLAVRGRDESRPYKPLGDAC